MDSVPVYTASRRVAQKESWHGLVKLFELMSHWLNIAEYILKESRSREAKSRCHISTGGIFIICQLLTAHR